MKINIIISIAFTLTFFSAYTQPETIGLLQNDNLSSEGYTLFSPEKNNNVYLINNCGEAVNTWFFTERPGLTSYLLNNGNLLRVGKNVLEIRDWNNGIIWSFDLNSISPDHHHDIEPLPNGNILVLTSTAYNAATMLDNGKDPSNLGAEFKLDKVIELEPTGVNSTNVVWEWNFFDHLIQEFDNTKPNFGLIIDHPELLDMNYIGVNATDFTHVNGIDFNEELNQIIVSARHTNELYIIDHSTTTLEASSHSGGDYGKGGDFLWRWGNPIVYHAGTIADRHLGKQHDSKWIESGTYAGDISVYNNDGDGSTVGSSVHIISPSHNSGVYDLIAGEYSPVDFTWSWSGDVFGQIMSESKKCGVQILPNDNALIVETSHGRMSEVSPTGDVVWVYVNPVGPQLMSQYGTVDLNEIFRAHRYSPDFIGFDNVSFGNPEIIEDINLISNVCNTAMIKEHHKEFSLFPNPTNGEFTILSTKPIDHVEIFSIQGEKIAIFDSGKINLENFVSGTYLIKITSNSIVYVQNLMKK